MKFLFDLFPIILFFVAYKFAGIFAATAVAIVATIGQISWVWFRHRKVDTMLWVSLAIVTIFGGATLFFHNPTFIKWKPTVLYGAMALALAIAVWGMKKNILQMLLGSQLTLPDGVWMRLNQAWIAYCAFMSAVNAYVVMNFSTEFWVDFKLWGYAFPLVFLVGQGLYIAPHIKGDEPAR